MTKLFYSFLLGLLAWLSAGQSMLFGQPTDNGASPYNVAYRINYAPAMLHPANYVDPVGEYMLRFMFQPLTAIDPRTLAPVPVIAESLPTLKRDSLGHTLLTYTTRPEASWDSGRKIVARDVLFSLKVLKCPGVDNAQRRKTLKSLKDAVLYVNAPRKITLVFDSTYNFEQSDAMHDLFIMDQYSFDPENILSNYSLRQLDSLSELDKSIVQTKGLLKFSVQFNQKNYDYRKIIGSGAYKVRQLGLTDEMLMDRKTKWWGDLFQGVNPYFDAFPSQLIFTIVEDDLDALKLLADNKLDVIGGLSNEAWGGLKQTKNTQKTFFFQETPSLSYEYIVCNTRRKILSEKATRRALAHLLDYTAIVANVNAEEAVRAVTFVPAPFKVLFNKAVSPHAFDSLASKSLLAEAGWSDTDGDGLVDKLFSDGSKLAFQVDLAYPNNNSKRKLIAEMLQKEARKLGIAINLQGFDQRFLMNKLNARNFDLMAMGWFHGPTLLNPKDLWHSNAYAEGNNFSGLQNAEVDSLSNVIAQMSNHEQMAAPMKRLQEIIHEEVPYIFLTSEFQRVLISKRFKPIEASAMRPGVWLGSLKLNN